LNNVHIVGMGRFLPNAAVENDSAEARLGAVGGRPSRARRVTLRNNGIRTRHYAIDPDTGEATHTNAQLTTAAVRDALERTGWTVTDLDLLACGTSSPDQLKPGHAPMVHGELGGGPLEAVSTAGVCCAGMAALKYAWMMLRAGGAKRAAATGSENASSFMVARNFPGESEDAVTAGEARAGLAFEQDFLRWMLSDGAGAALLDTRRGSGPIALRIDWIEGVSLAHELPACMYSGAIRDAEGRLRGWREAASPVAAAREHYFTVKQDARLLDEHLPRLVSADTFGRALARHGLVGADVDWFVPHYSSDYFRPRLAARLAEIGHAIPDERWFSNLDRVGNVGSASIYLALEELLRSGRLSRGQRILAFVPESARFSAYYMQLTVD